MRILSNGDVAIGATYSVDHLYVSKTAGSSIGIGTGGVAGTVASPLYTSLNFRGYGDYIKGQIQSYDVSSNAVGGLLTFSVQDTGATLTERMRIDSAGNVGIGTTSPANKLSVIGAVNASSILVSATNTTFSEGTGATNGQIYFDPVRSNRSLSVTTQQVAAGDDIDGVAFNVFYTNTGDPVDLLFRNGGNNNLCIKGNGNIGIGTTSPSQALHVSGSARVTGAYYDSSNSAGSSGQVLSSTGSGTAWVNQGEATATSLFDLLPAARVTYDWTVQLTAGTWADIFSSNTVLSNGTWMVQAYVNDYAVGGTQYLETYSGVMSWGSANSTNNVGIDGTSEIILHRSGHAANAGNFYLRTVERASSTLLFQGMSNQTYSAASTINFKFVKIF
jgi:hypothetical protein